MKKAFIVSSLIEVDNSNKLTYSDVRSYFSNIDRLRHTVVSIASIDSLRDNDNCTIFLLDASIDYKKYKGVFSYQTNLKFISVAEEFPEILDIVNTHPSKTYCENLIILTFIEKYKQQLLEYDYIVKMSGRYFIDGSFDLSILNENNLDKLIFKNHIKFDWVDDWHYPLIDNRKEQQDNKVYIFPSTIYAFGKNKFEQMHDIYKVISIFTDHKNGIHYDLESLLYFFTRQYKDNIIETDWKIYGWSGTDGTFLRY